MVWFLLFYYGSFGHLLRYYDMLTFFFLFSIIFSCLMWSRRSRVCSTESFETLEGMGLTSRTWRKYNYNKDLKTKGYDWTNIHIWIEWLYNGITTIQGVWSSIKMAFFRGFQFPLKMVYKILRVVGFSPKTVLYLIIARLFVNQKW